MTIDGGGTRPIGPCYISGMQAHSRNLLLQMLDRANISVVDGERHLRAQEALLVEQNRTGRQRAESAKLLRNMRNAVPDDAPCETVGIGDKD